MRKFIVTEEQLREMGVLAFEGNSPEIKIGIHYESITELKEKGLEKPTGEEAAKYMSNYVNNMSMTPDEFVATMAQDHRTLQQSFTGLCLAWLQHLASLSEGWYDLRNEASVKVAKKIMAQVEEANWKRLPFV